ncbi:membrane protein [Arthrobacter phage Bumble]|uniref:Uncharacterized protein n=1 Tax=Arthrobacter phage Bumble TaxID=2743904 RepID=A0A7G3VCF2_9CAUD|nr:hypothetical protein SEA_BUMBLE_33 [Arthrobacter phage Bumble]
MGRRTATDPDLIARGPLRGLRLTPRGRALTEAGILVAGSALGAAGLLSYINLIPALADWIAK